VESFVEGDPVLGGPLRLRAEVELNGLRPEDVDVQTAFGSVDGEDRLSNVETASLGLTGTPDGVARYEGEVTLRRTGPVGYTVRVLPRNELMASPAELGVVTTA
jgi:glycogen phosphorylase